MKSVTFAICTALTIASCAARKPAEYSAKLAACQSTARSCDEYVECRLHVAQEFGRTFSGTCVDGGAP